MSANSFLHALHRQTVELQDTVAVWTQLPASALSTPPAPGSWSVAQCLDHLNGYGLFYLPHLERVLRERVPSIVPEFRSGWLGNYFANSMEPDATGKPKSKMKAVAKHQPSPELDVAAVLKLFLRQQEELLTLIDRARSADLNRRAVPLSIAGWLRLKTGDVLRFLVAHNRRHFAQAQRALLAAGVQTPDVRTTAL